MTTFHRFVDPAYFDAPVLGVGPATTPFDGILYNRFNVTSGGTGAGGSAFMDAVKGAGPNTGTYAVAFGEDASSSNANRGLRAVLENTDYLDDLFHRDIAIPIVTAVTVAGGGGDPSIILPAGTFVGDVLTYPINMLFELVDSQDRELINNTTGNKIYVASIAGAAIGDGFSAGLVTLNFSENVPAGTSYKIYYSSRGNLATMPADSLSYIRIRGAQEVSAEVEDVLRRLQGGGAAWNDAWATTIFDLDAAVTGGIHRIKEESPRTDLANIDPTALTTGEIRLVPGSGLYRLKKATAGDDGPAQWIIESVVTGADRWENVLYDRLGTAYGLATLDSNAEPAQDARKIMRVTSLAALDALVDTNIATGDIRQVQGSEHYGIYALQAGVIAPPADHPWMMRLASGGTRTWVHELADLVGQPEGIASLNASGQVLQYAPYASVAIVDASSSGTITSLTWQHHSSAIVPVKNGDQVYAELIVDLTADGGDTAYGGISYELNGGGFVDPGVGSLFEFSTTATSATRGVAGGVISVGADGTLEVSIATKGAGVANFGTYNAYLKVTIVRP